MIHRYMSCYSYVISMFCEIFLKYRNSVSERKESFENDSRWPEAKSLIFIFTQRKDSDSHGEQVVHAQN